MTQLETNTRHAIAVLLDIARITAPAVYDAFILIPFSPLADHKTTAELQETLDGLSDELSELNLDGYFSPDELRGLADKLDILSHAEVSVIRQYARMKATAMDQRLAGEIQRALVTEDRCEFLYKRMPKYLRW